MAELFSMAAGYPWGRPIIAESGRWGHRDITHTPVGDGLRLVFDLLCVVWPDPEAVVARFNAYCALDGFPAVIRRIDIGRASITLQIESDENASYLATEVGEFSRSTVLAAAGYSIAAHGLGLSCAEIVEDMVGHGLCDEETAIWFATNISC